MSSRTARRVMATLTTESQSRTLSMPRLTATSSSSPLAHTSLLKLSKCLRSVESLVESGHSSLQEDRLLKLQQILHRCFTSVSLVTPAQWNSPTNSSLRLGRFLVWSCLSGMSLLLRRDLSACRTRISELEVPLERSCRSPTDHLVNPLGMPALLLHFCSISPHKLKATSRTYGHGLSITILTTLPTLKSPSLLLVVYWSSPRALLDSTELQLSIGCCTSTTSMARLIILQ
jgi:hypothetical protein